MAEATLVDLVKITALTTGTGAVTLGEAVPGYRGREALLDGAVYGYSIQQEAEYEIGRCTFLLASNQIVRTPEFTSNGGPPINLQANASIAFVATAEDILGRDVLRPLYGYGEPTNNIGLLGQVYTDLNVPVTLYGPKTAEGWGTGVVLQGNNGAPGSAAAYKTLTSLKAANPAALFYAYTPDDNTVVNYSLQAGNFTNKADDVNVVKLEAVPINVGALVRQSVAGTTTQSNASTLVIRTDDAFSHVQRLSRYTRSGSQDDFTYAFQDAIAEATERKVAEIVIPFGTYPVGQIVYGGLPFGLAFTGEGAHSLNPAESAVELRCGNSGSTWAIRYPDGDDSQTGGWRWRGLRFISTVADNTIFDLNDASTHDPVEPHGYSKIMFPSWEACYFDTLAGVTGTRTGDGIRAAKTFGLSLDRRCQGGYFRRFVWLHGCDDSWISARIAGERGIMIEGVNTFGSNTLVDSRFLSSPAGIGPEDAFQIWDSGYGTTIMSPSLEGQGKEKALMYLNGRNTKIYGARMAGGKLFQLGRFARDVKFINPDVPGYNASWAPIIDAPDSWDFGVADYRMEIVGAGGDFRRMAGENPRLDYKASAPASGPGVPVKNDQLMVAAVNGLRPAQHYFSALNNGALCAGTDAGAGPSSVVQDPASLVPGGWVFEFDHTIANSGFNWPLVIGEDLAKADKLRWRFRYISGDSANGWLLRIFRNNNPDGVNGFQFMTGTSGSWVNMDRVIDLAAYEPGDVMRIMLYQFAPPNAKMRFGFTSLQQVSDAPTQPSGGTVVDVEARAWIAAADAVFKERGFIT